MSEGRRLSALADLLKACFDVGELQGFVISLDGGGRVWHEVPQRPSLSAAVSTVVTAAARRGLINANFFKALVKAREGRASEIAAVEAVWLVTPPGDQAPALDFGTDQRQGNPVRDTGHGEDAPKTTVERRNQKLPSRAGSSMSSRNAAGHASTETTQAQASSATEPLPGRELAAVVFLVVHGIGEMAGSDPQRAMTLLSGVVGGIQQKCADLRVFECIDGAILVFPRCLPETGGKPLDVSELVLGAMKAAGKKGLHTRVGIAHGHVDYFKDTDGRDNVAGARVNDAARIARSTENKALMVDDLYRAHVLANLDRPHWLLDCRASDRKTVAGKHEGEDYRVFSWPGTVEVKSTQAKVSPASLKPGLLLAFDLPGFSKGDDSQILKRVQELNAAIGRFLKARGRGGVDLFYSPGGDGGVLLLPEKDATQARGLGADLLRELELANTHLKTGSNVDARVALHHGELSLYRSARGAERLVGAVLFEVDKLVGVKDAGRLLLSTVVVEAVTPSLEIRERSYTHLRDLVGARGRALGVWAPRGAHGPSGPGPSGGGKPGAPLGDEAKKRLRVELKRILENRSEVLKTLGLRLGVEPPALDAVIEGMLDCEASGLCLGLARDLKLLVQPDRLALWGAIQLLLSYLISREQETDGERAFKIPASNATVASLVVAHREKREVRFVLRRPEADIMDERCVDLPASVHAPLRPAEKNLRSGIAQSHDYLSEESLAEHINQELLGKRAKGSPLAPKVKARMAAGPRYTMLVSPDEEELWSALKAAVQDAFPDLQLALIGAGPDEDEAVAESLKHAFDVVNS